jgi:uncharacterized membrane protein YbhN (UPF0104 family)
MFDLPGTTRMRIAAVNLRLIKGGLTLGVLGYVVAQVEPSAIRAALAGAVPGWVAGALLLLPLNLLVAAGRWHTAVQGVAPATSLRQALAAVLCGRTLGFLTPARIGDYAGRALSLRHPDKPALVTLAVVEQMPGLLIFLTAGTGALLYSSLHLHVLKLSAWVPVLALGGAVGLGTLVLLFLPPRLLQGLQRRVPGVWLGRSLHTLECIPPRTMALLLGWSLVQYGVFTTQFFCLVRALAPDTAAGAGYAGIALVFYAKSLLPPVTFMDLGIREGAAVFFLGLFGVPQAAAFNAALLLFGVNLVLPALFGMPFAGRLLRVRQPGQPMSSSLRPLVADP